MQSKAARVTIYVGESDQFHGKSLYLSLLEFLKQEGARGATATRGVAGFGAHSRIHTASLVELASNLPIKVEWIDAPAQVERLLPELRRRVTDGLITVESLEVVLHSSPPLTDDRPASDADPLAQPVAAIMRQAVTSVPLDASLPAVVKLLIERGHRAVPVVDEDGRAVGMISDGDLLRLAGIKARLSLQGDLSPEVLHQQFAELAAQKGAAQDIMRAPVVTVRSSEPVRTAAQRMLDSHFKRLPVVDDANRLVGIVTRVDVLRLVGYSQPFASRTRSVLPGALAPPDVTIANLMQRDVPTVAPGAGLEEVLAALEESHQRRVIVVDDARCALGIITDGDILERSRHGDHPGLLARLRDAVLGAPATPVALPASHETAADLMSTPVTTVGLETPLYTALDLMIWYDFKRLPVVDEQGALVGLLGRASLLQGIMQAV